VNDALSVQIGEKAEVGELSWDGASELIPVEVPERWRTHNDKPIEVLLENIYRIHIVNEKNRWSLKTDSSRGTWASNEVMRIQKFDSEINCRCRKNWGYSIFSRVRLPSWGGMVPLSWFVRMFLRVTTNDWESTEIESAIKWRCIISE